MKAAFQKVLKLLRTILFKTSLLTKTILTLLTLFLLLPNIFIWTLYHTRYSLPQENGFSLEGRSALIQRENKLYIYNWTKPDNTLFGIQNKYTETLIKDYTNKQFPLNTAILPNNLIVVGEVENNIYTIKTINPNTKEEKTIKEYKVFNLNQFYQDYKNRKITFNPKELITQTSLQYSDHFQVSTNTISFLDFTVTEVDQEKPVEAMAFEREINFTTGKEILLERGRERWGL